VSGFGSVLPVAEGAPSDDFQRPGVSNEQMSSRPYQVAFAVRGPIRRADLPSLCERASALLECVLDDRVADDVQAGTAADGDATELVLRLNFRS